VTCNNLDLSMCWPAETVDHRQCNLSDCLYRANWTGVTRVRVYLVFIQNGKWIFIFTENGKWTWT